MDSGTSDGHHGVQEADHGLEELKVGILVREDAEHSSMNADANAGVHVLFRRLEPSVTLGLRKGSELGGRRAAGSHIPA